MAEQFTSTKDLKRTLGFKELLKQKLMLQPHLLSVKQ